MGAMQEDPARRRWFIMTLTRIAGTGGAVLGLLLLGRSADTVPKVIGAALVLASLYMLAVVPLALARRWKSPKS